MRKKYLLFFLLVLIFSCSKNYIEKGSFTKEGDSIIIFENGGSILGISSRKEINFQFNEKLNESELQSFFQSFEIFGRDATEKRLLKVEPIKTVLNIVSYKEGKKEILFNNFITLNPKYCEGITNSVSSELFKGEQNIGKYGILLPLYKIGCTELDWVFLNIIEKKIYFFEEEGSLREVKELPLHSECGGTIYCGQNHYAIISPEFKLYATLSKKGRLRLCNFQLGKMLFERENVISFCFHPERELLYFGTENGLFVFDCESNQIDKLTNISPRLIRISQKGSYLLVLLTGGENKTQILKLQKIGKKIEKIEEFNSGNADDWVFLDDLNVLGVFNSKSFIILKNLITGNSQKIYFPENFFTVVLNSALFPTIILKKVEDQTDDKIFYFNSITKQFDKAFKLN